MIMRALPKACFLRLHSIKLRVKVPPIIPTITETIGFALKDSVKSKSDVKALVSSSVRYS